MTDQIAAERGWEPLSKKTDPTSPGLDRVYLDPNTNEVIIVESKFIEGRQNVGGGRLRTRVDREPQIELTHEWIFGSGPGKPGAIDRSLRNGDIDLATKMFIEQADVEGRLHKELVVVRNRHSGRTITDRLSRHPELGGEGTKPIRRTTIIELPNGTVAKPRPRPSRCR
jgi:hypothetical protein